MGFIYLILPRKELVDPGIVIVIVPDSEETLDVALNGHPELGGVHTCHLANAHVGQVLDDAELVIQKFTHLKVVELFNRGVSLVVPIEILG